VEIAVLILIVWLVCGIAAGVISSNRGSSGCLWFGLGVLFGPFALIAAFFASDEWKCPHCQRSIAKEATRCPHCQGAINWHKLDEHPYPCPKCGIPQPVDAVKCGSCGVALKWREEEAVAETNGTKICPFCAETILVAAKKCRFCGEFLEKDSQT